MMTHILNLITGSGAADVVQDIWVSPNTPRDSEDGLTADDLSSDEIKAGPGLPLSS